jgi:hypothetical protein
MEATASDSLKRANVPVASVLMRVGLTPEVIADPEERLSVRSQITLLDEAAMICGWPQSQASAVASSRSGGKASVSNRSQVRRPFRVQ